MHEAAHVPVAWASKLTFVLHVLLNTAVHLQQKQPYGKPVHTPGVESHHISRLCREPQLWC